eukprot:2976359-Pleurochrysis_carterae.AAC.2
MGLSACGAPEMPWGGPSIQALPPKWFEMRLGAWTCSPVLGVSVDPFCLASRLSTSLPLRHITLKRMSSP